MVLRSGWEHHVSVDQMVVVSNRSAHQTQLDYDNLAPALLHWVWARSVLSDPRTAHHSPVLA